MVILELRHEFSLSTLLEIAQLPRATFYYHNKRMAQKDKYTNINGDKNVGKGIEDTS